MRLDYGLEPRVHVEPSKDRANVVADRVVRDPELVGHLLRRAATREQVQDLRLAWCECDLPVRRPRNGSELVDRHEREHAGDALSSSYRDTADLAAHECPVASA